jgi:galactose-1-phosphate uridylyltransferase
MSAALRFDVTIGENHRLELEVPGVPEGPAEVIVIPKALGGRRELTEDQRQALAYMLSTPLSTTPPDVPPTLEMLREDRAR